MAEPAPYGGFMTRTIDAEKEQEEKLKLQQVEIAINGTPQTLRPEALHINGVDNLSTEDLQAFVDYYLNFDKIGDDDYKEVERPIWFRIQWIDDSNVNVVFKTHEDAAEGLGALSISGGASEEIVKEFGQEYVSQIVQERETKPYAPTIAFHKYQKRISEEKDLFEEKKQKEEEDANTGMDEDDSSVVLYIRQSLQSDRKVKNAAVYSRYYLLHGEPDREQRRRTARPERLSRAERGGYSRDEDDDVDLFASKLKETKSAQEEDEEDLFAWRLREASPERAPKRGGRGGRGSRRGRGRR